MHWYILDEAKRPQTGRFVAVAVAFNELEATLLRDYLVERHILTYVPPATLPYPLIDKIYIWVPLEKAQEAVALLEMLTNGWQEEPTDESE